MRAYVDTSVLLRVVLSEPGALAAWSQISEPMCSELLRIESLRTIDRARVQGRLTDGDASRVRADLLRMIDTFSLIELDDRVKARAAEPYPTSLRSLAALHLASALLATAELGQFPLATHDEELAVAATAVGFEVLT